MLRFIVAGLVCAPLFGQATNVRISGATNTQAILAYTAPDAAACSLEVSQSATFSPLVHDVDPAIFAGANADSRAGNIVNGTSRQFVIGKRARAYLADSGKYFSRALLANTTHYYRLTCSGGSVTGSFTTVNTPFGQGFNDNLLADPANPGEVPMAQFVTRADRAEAIIDPDTGFPLTRIDVGDDLSDPHPAQTFDEAVSSDATWTNPANVFTDDGNSASASTGTGFLWAGYDNTQIRSFDYLGPSLDSNHNESISYLRMHIKGTMSGCGAGPCNLVTVCAGMRDGTCYTTPTDVALDGTDKTVGLWSPGAGSGYDPDLNGARKVTRFAAFTHKGAVTTAMGSSSVVWTSGDFFDLAWTAGDKIRFSNTSQTASCLDSDGGTHEFTVSNVKHGMALVTTASVDASYAFYCASNFGIIMRRKAPDANTANLNYATFDVDISTDGASIETGFTRQCSYVLIDGGYYCHLPMGGSGGLGLYHINPTTGVKTFIGPWLINSNQNGTGADRWVQNLASGFSSTIDTTQPVLTTYASLPDIAGKTIILKMTYSGPPTTENNTFGLGSLPCADQTPDAYSTTCTGTSGTTTVVTDLTPSSLSEDVSVLLHGFDATFDTTVFPPQSISLFAVENGKLFVGAKNQADTRSWVAVLDPGDGVPTHAGTTGMHVIAMGNSWSGVGCRWSLVHSFAVFAGSNPYPGMSCESSLSSSIFGTGPWWATTNDSITTSLTDCQTLAPNNSLGAMGANCTLVHINAHGSTHPYEPFYAGANVTEPDYLQDAIVGDNVCLATTTTLPCFYPAIRGEVAKIVLKSYNACSPANSCWVLWRGRYGTAVAAHSGPPVYLHMTNDSMPQVTPVLYGGQAWFDFTGHPHGDQYIVDPLYYDAHDAYGPGLAIEFTDDQGTGLCGARELQGGASSCYRARVGATLTDIISAPSMFTNNLPPFAGQFSSSGGSSNSYPTHATGAALGIGADNQWFSDSRPMFVPNQAVTWALQSGTSSVYQASNLPGFHLKLFFLEMTAGPHVLRDMSSPATGNQITDATPWTYCVALKANECRSAAAAGSIYVSAPNRTHTSCQGTFFGVFEPSGNIYEDICIAESTSFGFAVTQQYAQDDPFGLAFRRISSYMGRPKWLNSFPNNRILPNGAATFFLCEYCDKFRSTTLLAQVPPRPPNDTVNRGDFVPVELTIKGVPGADGVVADFGYQEYGSDGVSGFYCMTRQENCVANQAGLGATRYFWASESFSPLACANGASCKLTIPGISGRVLYYRIRRTLSGATVAIGSTEMVATP